MSNQVFPSFSGTGINIKRTTEYASNIHETVGGKEQRISWWSTPRYQYQLNIEVVRDNLDMSSNTVAVASTGSEVGVILKFLDDHYGSFDSFLFNDPYDGVQRRVRFSQDSLTISKIVQNHWELGVKFTSVK